VGHGMYTLDGETPVPETDLYKWGRFMESHNRIVAKTNVSDEVRVSTVFLGLDHNYYEGPPILFETMIFGGKHDGYQERCATWAEAEAMHDEAVSLAMGRQMMEKIRKWFMK